MATVTEGDFEWDDVKAALNLQQHGVSFEEAATAFEDPRSLILDDGSGVERFVLIGFSHGGPTAHSRARRAWQARPHHQRVAGERQRRTPLPRWDDTMNTTKKVGTTPVVSGTIDLSKAKVVGRGTKRGRHFTLRMLRAALGKTQADIAKAAEMDQGDVSRLEAREDIKVSSLERYAAALGGEVEIAVLVGGRRYLLTV